MAPKVSKKQRPSKHELEMREWLESQLPNPLPLNKWQQIPLKGSASEALDIWGRNDFVLLADNLRDYRDGREPRIHADAITAGRRLDEIAAKILKLEKTVGLPKKEE